MAGSASVVRAFLVVEHDGPWGTDVLRAPRWPEADGLARAASETGVRVLATRRHRRADRGGRRVFAAHVDTGLWESGEVDDPRSLDLAALAAGRSVGLPPATTPYVGVCTHGRHDACCAERGRPVVNALAESRPGFAWEVSHLGGDRFAANLLVLPYGLYYGRVLPEEAATVVDLACQGRILLDRYRGRAGWPMPVQYAEIALRRRLARDEVGAVRLVGTGRADGGFESRFEVAGQGWRVVVRRELADAVALTCRAERDDPVPIQTVVALEPYSEYGA